MLKTQSPAKPASPAIHRFSNIRSFEKFLQKQYKFLSEELDYIEIAGRVYTMHEFDEERHTVTWGNKKHNVLIEVTTSNRYRNGYKDARVNRFPSWGIWRNDINFHE